MLVRRWAGASARAHLENVKEQLAAKVNKEFVFP